MKILPTTVLIFSFFLKSTLFASYDDERNRELAIIPYSENSDITKKSKSLYTKERPKTPHIVSILSPLPMRHGRQPDDQRSNTDIIEKNIDFATGIPLLRQKTPDQSFFLDEQSDAQIKALQQKATLTKTQTRDEIAQLVSRYNSTKSRNALVSQTALSAVVLACAKAPTLLDKILPKGSSRFFGFDDAAAFGLISSAMPTVLIACAGGFLWWKLDRLIHAEDRNNYANLKRDAKLKYCALDEKINKLETTIRSNTKAAITAATTDLQRDLHALSEHFQEQDRQHSQLIAALQQEVGHDREYISEKISQAKSESEKAQTKIDSVLEELHHVQTLNQQMAGQVAAMIPAVKKIENRVHNIATLPMLPPLERKSSRDLDRSPSPLDIQATLDQIIIDDADQKKEESEQTLQRKNKHFYSGFLPFKRK